MRILTFSPLIANAPFGRHGPWWIIVVLSLVGNLPSWKRARSVGLSSVRSNSWSTGPRRAGSAVAGSDVAGSAVTVVGTAAALFSGDGSAAGSSSCAGTDGATSTASRFLFSGLPSEVSSSPAVVVNKISGFYSCRPPHGQAEASSLVFFAAPEAYKCVCLSNSAVYRISSL